MRNGLLALVLVLMGYGVACGQCGPQGCSDQAAAERKLDTMIERSVLNRHIPPILGNFEGIGVSSQPGNIQTCTPRRRMNLTADVVRQAKNGMWVRLRVWR